MEELKACPYCGGRMQIAKSQLFTSEGVLDGYYGRCTACYARLAPQETRQKAVTACNRRSEPAINDFMDGIKYAIYEIFKEADIPGSQEIRDSGDTDDGMCARAAERIRAELTATPENKPLELHFGDGKIGVSTCRPEDFKEWNELLLWNPKMQQNIGSRIPIKNGTTTDDVEAYARLFFSNAESAQVVVDALNRIIDSFGGNKPLTLDELVSLGERAQDGENIIVYCTPLNDWAKVFKYGIQFFGTEDYRSWAEIGEDYGKMWIAYAHKPEGVAE